MNATMSFECDDHQGTVCNQPDLMPDKSLLMIIEGHISHKRHGTYLEHISRWKAVILVIGTYSPQESTALRRKFWPTTVIQRQSL